MRNTFLGMWPKRQPICNATNLPAFESPEAAESYFERYCAKGARIDSIYFCLHCEGFHAKSHLRAPSGDSSGTSRVCRPFPAAVIETNRRLSARDAGRE